MLNQFVFFGGKGGVGKTTCSAAFAYHCSKQGKRTLLVSTDPAHSLSDVFEQKIGSNVQEIAKNLYSLEIDPEQESREYIKTIKSNMKHIVSPVIISEISKQLDAASVSPGSEEAAIFDKLVEIMVTNVDDYDQIVFDTAPTGHTLRLLSLPELLGAWLGRLIKKRKSALELKEMADKHERGRQEKLLDDPVIKILQQRKDKLEKAREILIDSHKVSFIFVLNAEKLPIEETKKAVKVLEKYQVPVGGIVVNRILPEDMQDIFWKSRKELEQKYLAEIQQAFKNKKITYLPLLNTDVRAHVLEQIADHFQ